MERTRPSAEIWDMEDIQQIADEMEDEQVYTPALIIGDPVEGEVYLISHECPRCHAKMDTAGIGYIKCYCARCWVLRGKNVTMNARFTELENE